jgi:glycosyltransferase involved in cell wall biosynthesis
MKVALVTPVYPPYRGGMGAVAAQDARDLKARGFEVAVYTPDYGRDKNPEAIYVHSPFKIGNAALLPALFKRLGRVNLVHLHYPFYGAEIFVWLWSVLKRRPYVMTYHMRPHAPDWRQIIFTLHRWLIEPWIIRRASAIFVSSLDYAQAVGLRHRHLIERPFSVDGQKFSPGLAPQVRDRYHLPASACVFVFVGGLDQAHVFKGVDVLLRAAATLPPTPAWRLLIVGEGDLRSSYEGLARELGIADKVIFTGAVSEGDLPTVYQAADVHVLPSVSASEAFGLVTLEAAASGLPSIVSDLPGVRTLVVPGQTGSWVTSGDLAGLAAALRLLLDDPELRKRQGLQARQRISQDFHEDKLAECLVEVYKKRAASEQV